MNNNRGFKKKLIASAIASYAAFGIGTQAFAQEQSGAVDEVVVTGVRAALISAMATKRDASGVVDAINAEDIGKMPDTNLAESLQRIPGVSIDREGGEGKYVTVRGFSAGFNVTTLNGRQITSENVNRDFEFDTLGSEMINGLVINKSGSALTDSGGIGATIDIRTSRPFDVGNKIAGSLKLDYEILAEESAPQASIMVSQKFADDAFGVLFAYNHFERESTVNRVTNNNWLRIEKNSGNANYPEPTELTSNANADGRIYLPQNHFINLQKDKRTRDNANLVLQFAPSDDLTITADVLYSDYELLRDQNMLVNWFGSRGSWRDVVADENGTVTHFIADRREGEGAVQATEFNAIKENRKSDTLVAGLNAKWDLSDNFSVIGDVYRSESNYEDPMGFGNSQVTMGYRNRLTWDMSGGFIPYISGFESGTGAVGYQPDMNGQLTIPNKDYLDPSNLRPGFTTRTGRIVGDTIDQFKFEGVYDSNEDDGLVKANFGLSHKSREKAREKTTTERTMTDAEWATVKAKEPNVPDWVRGAMHCMFCDGQAYWTKITPPKITVLDAGSNFLSGVSSGGKIQTQWLQFDHDEFRRIYEGHVGVPFNTAKVPSESYTIGEDITSLYTQLEFAGDLAGHRYSLVTGLRYEKTDLDVAGNLASLIDVMPVGNEVLQESITPVTPTTFNADYAGFLPNLDFKIDFTADLVGRASFSKTITRPSMTDMRPGLTFGDLKQRGPYPVDAGNSDLKPLESENMDLSLEWYYGEGSYASAGVFYKLVDNFIVNATTGEKINGQNGTPVVDPSTGQQIVFQVTKPSNVETADVQGFEFAVQHMFGETGFGTVANATFVSTNAEFDTARFDRSFVITGLSDSYNIVGFYENDKYQVRLAYNWRDQFLMDFRNNEPVFVEAYGQWDLSASYNLTKNFTLTLDGINITGEANRQHARFSNQFLLAEESGPRYTLGVRASF